VRWYTVACIACTDSHARMRTHMRAQHDPAPMRAGAHAWHAPSPCRFPATPLPGPARNHPPHPTAAPPTPPRPAPPGPPAKPHPSGPAHRLIEQPVGGKLRACPWQAGRVQQGQLRLALVVLRVVPILQRRARVRLIHLRRRRRPRRGRMSWGRRGQGRGSGGEAGPASEKQFERAACTLLDTAVRRPVTPCPPSGPAYTRTPKNTIL
jgi:hypothetical protein